VRSGFGRSTCGRCLTGPAVLRQTGSTHVQPLGVSFEIRGP
jgi:hypothetical protein